MKQYRIGLCRRDYRRWVSFLAGLLLLAAVLAPGALGSDTIYVVNSYVHSTGADWSTVAKLNGGDMSVVDTLTVGDNAHSVAKDPGSNRLWVTCPASNNIAVINPSTMDLVEEIEMGDFALGPMGVAFSPYDGNAYVTLEETGMVAVFNPDSYARISTITVGGLPNFLTFTPDGGKAYVVDYQNSRVHAISTYDNSVVATLEFGGYALQDAVVSPDGSLVYLSNMDQNQIEVIRTRNDAVLTPIPTAIKPRGIGISPDGRYLFVGHYTAVDAYVNMMRLSDDRVVSTASIPSNPRYIVVRDDGSRIYVTEHNEDRCYAYDVSGETLTPAGYADMNTVPGFSASPVGMVLVETATLPTVPMLMGDPHVMQPLQPLPEAYVDQLPIKSELPIQSRQLIKPITPLKKIS